MQGCCDPNKQTRPNTKVSASDGTTLNKPMPAGRAEDLGDQEAHDRVDALIEDWGQKMMGAWGRVCRASLAQGVEIPSGCPKE